MGFPPLIRQVAAEVSRYFGENAAPPCPIGLHPVSFTLSSPNGFFVGSCATGKGVLQLAGLMGSFEVLIPATADFFHTPKCVSSRLKEEKQSEHPDFDGFGGTRRKGAASGGAVNYVWNGVAGTLFWLNDAWRTAAFLFRA